MQITDGNLDNKMQRLRQKYLEHLEIHAAKLRLFLDVRRADDLPPDIKESVRETAHRLAGSGATYGYAAISAAARRLEDSLTMEPKPDADDMMGKARALLDACVNARAAQTDKKRPA